jgi:hypothetical protein
MIPEPAVEGNLTATGLILVISDCNSCLFKHFNHAETCFRVKLIDKAGNKYIHNHSLAKNFNKPTLYLRKKQPVRKKPVTFSDS